LTTPTVDELLADWRGRWLPSFRDQVYDLHSRKQMHDEFLDMLEAQAHDDREYFGDFVHRTYLEAQTMAIRRQADDDKRTLSLRRLIGQLEKHRKDFTREWYVGRWMEGYDLDSEVEGGRLEARFHLDMANDAFDEFTDKPGDSALGGRRLQEDRDQLTAMTAKVVTYVNEHVAHVAAEPASVAVTYGEFEQAIDHLGTMLKRYYLLLNQSALVSVTPTIQGDWKGPFRRPLAD
jgi:hypothetical protein